MDFQLSGNRWFNITTTGLARIQNAVMGLDNFQQNKAITSGMRAAGSVFIAGGRKRLRRELKGTGKGYLMQSFRTKVKRRNAGVVTGFDKWGNHSHLVDLGTKKRYQKNGHYTGIMPANYFWRTTAQADFPRAAEKMYRGIETAANRIMYGNR